MIIQNKFIFNSFEKFLIDSLISSAKKLENKINEIYVKAINSIDFNKVVCNKCRSVGNYEIKGYYHRYIIINNYKLRINILRIKCRNCGRTHAILFLDFIPYYQLSAIDSKIIIDNDFKDEYYDTLNTVGTAETAAAAHRRHVLTFQDTSAFGKPVPNALPAYLPGNWFSNYLRLSIGPKPEPGRKCRLILGFNTADVPDFEIWLNTRPLTLTRIFENKKQEQNTQVLELLQSAKDMPKSSVVCAEFDATDAVVSGSNIIILKNKEEKSCSITWVEFDIEA